MVDYTRIKRMQAVIEQLLNDCGDVDSINRVIASIAGLPGQERQALSEHMSRLIVRRNQLLHERRQKEASE